MPMKWTFSAAALLTSLLLPALAVPVGAFAQAQPPAEKPSATPRPKASAPRPKSEADPVEQHITELHAQLQITPAQQAQWDQFAQVMRDNARDMKQALEQRRASFASMNAAENMESYAQIAQQHAQDTVKLAAAFQTLYGSLSDEQKKNADEVFRAEGVHPGHRKR